MRHICALWPVTIMKAYPKYDLCNREVIFFCENGKTIKRPIKKSELLWFNAADNNVPGVDRFINQLKEPVELIEKICTLVIKMHKFHVKTEVMTEETVEKSCKYWDIPGMVRPEKADITRFILVND